MIKMIKEIQGVKNFLARISRTMNSSKYYIVYKTDEGKTKTYLIGDIDLYKSFKNKRQSRDNAGFKAYCFARKQVRSFRHDRIISLTKK